MTMKIQQRSVKGYSYGIVADHSGGENLPETRNQKPQAKKPNQFNRLQAVLTAEPRVRNL